MFSERLVIPTSFRQQVLEQFHFGHIGRDRIQSIVRSYVYWRLINKQIADYVTRCSRCASSVKNKPESERLTWFPTNTSWSSVHLDKQHQWMVNIFKFSLTPVPNDRKFTQWQTPQQLQPFHQCMIFVVILEPPKYKLLIMIPSQHLLNSRPLRIKCHSTYLLVILSGPVKWLGGYIRWYAQMSTSESY